MKKELSIRIALFAVSFLAMLYGYWLMLSNHAPAMFASDIEDMSYAWYVPLFSLYVVWKERREIVASLGSPSIAGLLLALPSFAAGFLGIRGHQLRLEIVGFAGLIISLAWLYFGAKTMRRILFPALFLLFCMPLATYLDVITVHLRIFSTSAAYVILKGVGVDVIRQGTMLASSTGSFAIDVADPCSGLRSLFALTALTAGYAYFNQPTWLRRGLLFALSVPIAVFGNVVRILTIVLVAACCSPDFATGFYHDYSGYVVFMAAILMMLGASAAISKGAER
jgi:exosortase